MHILNLQKSQIFPFLYYYRPTTTATARITTITCIAPSKQTICSPTVI